MKPSFILSVAVNFIVTYLNNRASSQSITGLEQCISHKKVTGCSIPFNSSFPYRAVFKPACNRHEVCYHCGNRFDWSRNDCDVGFLYDMYYACAIKDVEQRRRRVHRSVSKLVKKSTNSKTEKSKRMENYGERSIEIDEKTAENIRKTAARLIQHDTAAIIEDLQKETEKREETSENIKGLHHSKTEVKKEMKEKEMNEIKEESKEEKGEKQQHQEKKNLKIHHESEAETDKKTKKATEKSVMNKMHERKNKKHERKNNKADKVSESQLKLISSKYHEMEKVLLELKSMIELEQDRLAEDKHGVGNGMHLADKNQSGIEENTIVKEPKHFVNSTKRRLKLKEDKKQGKAGNIHRNKKSKKNDRESNKTKRMKEINKQIKKEENTEHEDLTTQTAGNDKKQASTFQENESNSEGRSFFQRCKLAAYLYFIAVRGFGDKFYLKKAPLWCEKGCIKANGGIHFKKLRRPRAII